MKNLVLLSLAIIAILSCEEDADEPVPQLQPTASFELIGDSIHTYRDIKVQNTTTDADSYFWNFGNGDTSVASEPNHVYERAGEYTVSLKAFSRDKSLTSEASKTIIAFNRNKDYVGAYSGTFRITNQQDISCTLLVFEQNGEVYFDFTDARIYLELGVTLEYDFSLTKYDASPYPNPETIYGSGSLSNLTTISIEGLINPNTATVQTFSYEGIKQ